MERMIFISNDETARQRQQELLAAAERYRLARIARRGKRARTDSGPQSVHAVVLARARASIPSLPPPRPSSTQ
jgi:hypothetical protein